MDAVKPLTHTEVQSIVGELNRYLGAELQDFLLFEKQLGLLLQHQGVRLWIWMTLDARCPLIFTLERPPIKAKSLSRPLRLFFKAHFAGSIVESVTQPSHGDRRIIFTFRLSSGEAGLAEMRLFPHGQNFIWHMGEKSVSWSKVAPIIPPARPAVSQGDDVSKPRRLAEIGQHWLAQRQKTPLKQMGDLSIQQKLQRTISKVQKEVEQKRHTLWKQAGEYLVATQSMQVSVDLPVELKPYIEDELSLGENIQRCFAKAKVQQQKTQRTEARLAELTQQLRSIESTVDRPGDRRSRPGDGQIKSRDTIKNHLLTADRDLMKMAKARGRKNDLGEGVVAFIGRHGEDNLRLLRRAKSWDLWLHLRDYPGSHCVIRRNKHQTVSEAQLHQGARWLIEQTFKDKAKIKEGETFDVVLAEVKHVNPVKGASKGLVTFQQGRHLRVVYRLGS